MYTSESTATRHNRFRWHTQSLTYSFLDHLLRNGASYGSTCGTLSTRKPLPSFFSMSTTSTSS